MTIMNSVCTHTMNVEQCLSIFQEDDRQIDGYISEIGQGEIKQ